MTSSEQWKLFAAIMHAAADGYERGSEAWKAMEVVAAAADHIAESEALSNSPLELSDEVCGESYHMDHPLKPLRRCTLPPGHDGPHGRKA